MLKLLLFYGGMLVALLATVALWVFWRPKLIAQIFADPNERVLRCEVKTARTFQPIRITSLWIPTEYVAALGASPPKRFKEAPRRFTPKWPYDNATRELVAWKGKLEVRRGETVEIAIPASNPLTVAGTIKINYEYRGLGGIAIMATWIFVPFNGYSP